MLNICWPWEMEAFYKGREALLDFIYDKLVELGYDPNIKRPSADQITRLSNAFKSIALQKGGPTWAIYASTSDADLTLIERVLPVAFALTYQKAVFTVSSDLLFDLCRRPRPSSIWEVDPGDSILDNIEASWLLIFSRINAVRSGMTKYESTVSTILSNHAARRRSVFATVMTRFPAGNREKRMQKGHAVSQIANNFGPQASYLFDEYASFHMEDVS